MRAQMLDKEGYDEYDVMRVWNYLQKDKHMTYDICTAEGIQYLAYKRNESLVPPDFAPKTSIVTPSTFIEETSKQVAATVQEYDKKLKVLSGEKIETIYVSYRAPDYNKLNEYKKDAGNAVEAVVKELAAKGILARVPKDKANEFKVDEGTLREAEKKVGPNAPAVVVIPCLDIMDFYKLERYTNRENWAEVRNALFGAQSAEEHHRLFGRIAEDQPVFGNLLNAKTYEEFKGWLWKIMLAKNIGDEQKNIWFPDYEGSSAIKGMYAGGNCGEVLYQIGKPDENITRRVSLKDEFAHTNGKDGVLTGHWTSNEEISNIKLGIDGVNELHISAMRNGNENLEILPMLEDIGNSTRIYIHKGKTLEQEWNYQKGAGVPQEYEPITIIKLDPAGAEVKKNTKIGEGEDVRPKPDMPPAFEPIRVLINTDKEKISAKIFYDYSDEIKYTFMPGVINGIDDLRKYLNDRGSDILLADIPGVFNSTSNNDPENYDKMFNQYAAYLLTRPPSGKEEEFIMVLGDMAATDEIDALSKGTIDKMRMARDKLLAEGTRLRIYYVAVAPEKFSFAGKPGMQFKEPRNVWPQFRLFQAMLEIPEKNIGYAKTNFNGKTIVSTNGYDKIIWIQGNINNNELYAEYRRVIEKTLEEMKTPK